MAVLTLSDELERKVQETVEDLALRHEQGVLNDREFQIAINAVWNSCAGLCESVSWVMEEVSKMGLKPEPHQVVVSDGNHVFVVGRHKITVSVINAQTGAETNLKVFDLENEAATHVERLVAAFEKKGFRRV